MGTIGVADVFGLPVSTTHVPRRALLIAAGAAGVLDGCMRFGKKIGPASGE